MTYVSRTKAWPHQQQCHDWTVEQFAAGNRGVLLRLPMGTGKSKIAVDLISEHIARHADDDAPVRILILCPLSVCNVWPREFARHSGLSESDYWLGVLTGDIKQKHMQAEFAAQTLPVTVMVCNYDACWREPLAAWLLAQKWNMVIADESHRFKAIPTYKRKAGWSGEEQWEATSGKLAAFMSDLSWSSAFRLALTGTPMAHSPQDIFSQARFLDRGQRFGNSGWKFLGRYGVAGGYQGKEIVGWQRKEELSRLVNEFSWSCPEDVIQLPEAMHEVREFCLSKEARQAYDDMWLTLSAQVEAGEITAANGAVAFLRLQQITSGIGRIDGDKTVRIDKGKQLLLEDFLGDIDPAEKVVVFCQFQADLQAVREAADVTPGRKYGEISGRSKDGLSDTATFSDECNILGVQIQSGGTGIDLTAARYCVYFSPGLSLANYQQSLKRVHRPGQKRPVTFLHFNATGTIDAQLYDRLERREDLVEGILSLFKQQQEVAA